MFQHEHLIWFHIIQKSNTTSSALNVEKIGYNNSNNTRYLLKEWFGCRWVGWGKEQMDAGCWKVTTGLQLFTRRCPLILWCHSVPCILHFCLQVQATAYSNYSLACTVHWHSQCRGGMDQGVPPLWRGGLLRVEFLAHTYAVTVSKIVDSAFASPPVPSVTAVKKRFWPSGWTFLPHHKLQ